MRYVLITLFLFSTALGADVELLKKQLASIEDGKEAKEALMAEIQSIKKLADGVSADKARERIKMLEVTMGTYWGPEVAEILAKRLRGMIFKVNGVSQWTGTAAKFIALKKALIAHKKKQIDIAMGVTEEKQEDKNTHKVKPYTLLPNLVEKINNTKHINLLEEHPQKAIIREELYGCLWEIPISVNYAGLLRGSKKPSNEDALMLRGRCFSPGYYVQVTYFVLKSELPEKVQTDKIFNVVGHVEWGYRIIKPLNRNGKMVNGGDMCVYSEGYVQSDAGTKLKKLFGCE